MVIAKESGHQLYVRRKKRADLEAFGPARTLLLIHGATYPAHATFDLAPDGQPSWMDDLAEAGFDVHTVDLAGYGKSGLLPAMNKPPQDGEPLLTTREAVADIESVVDAICDARDIDQVCLIGWSWGSTIAAVYASRHAAKVARLVLHAPQWLRNPPPAANGGRLGAYRQVTIADGLDRWLGAIPEAEQEHLVPVAWREAWVAMNFLHRSAETDSLVTLAPNGVLKDSASYWASGRPLYDPSTITSPTLVIVGEWDRDTPLSMSTAVFEQLTEATEKRLVCVGRGTHMLMLERNRSQLFDEARLFLLQA
ncbi:MAG: alpha/beta fold hydrolase [Aquisalimonadaceae bacterium]